MQLNDMFERILESETPPECALYDTLQRRYRGRADFCAAKAEGPESLANFIFEEIENERLSECDDEAVFTAARWCCDEDTGEDEEELNESINKNKLDEAFVYYKPVTATGGLAGSIPNGWEKKFIDGQDFTTKEGLEDAASCWSSYYWSDYVHDIAHDGDRTGARECAKALSKLHALIMKGVEELGLTVEDTNTNSLKEIIVEVAKQKKNRAAAEKRAATKAANAKARVQAYIQELQDMDLPEEVRELFADDGYYKERRSYGTIKKYFDEPYGKALKAVWVDQFAS